MAISLFPFPQGHDSPSPPPSPTPQLPSFCHAFRMCSLASPPDLSGLHHSVNTVTNRATARWIKKKSAKLKWWEKKSLREFSTHPPLKTTLKYSERSLNTSWLEHILRAEDSTVWVCEVFYVVFHKHFPSESDYDLPLLIRQHWLERELTTICLLATTWPHIRDLFDQNHWDSFII